MLQTQTFERPCISGTSLVEKIVTSVRIGRWQILSAKICLGNLFHLEVLDPREIVFVQYTLKWFAHVVMRGTKVCNHEQIHGSGKCYIKHAHLVELCDALKGFPRAREARELPSSQRFADPCYSSSDSEDYHRKFKALGLMNGQKWDAALWEWILRVLVF